MNTLLASSAPRNRNRVEIQKIYPAKPKNNLLNENNAVLGISLGSPATVGNKVLAIFDFLYRQGLNNITLFIGDGLYQYTAMLKHQCDQDEAIKIGQQEAQQLIQYYQTELITDTTPYQLNVLLSSELIKGDECQCIIKNLWQLYRENKTFNQSVANFADFYLTRQLLTGIDNTPEDAYKYAYSYLIDELAIFAILNKRGFNTLVYPGAIRTICEIITMDEPYLQQIFANYIFVALRLKRAHK